MSTNVAASFGSYPHPFCGSRATRMRMYPSASQSEQRTVSRTRPFTGNEASNSRPDLIGRGTAMRTAVATINPTTRELQVVAGGCTTERRGGPKTEGRRHHNSIVQTGPVGRGSEGNPVYGGKVRGVGQNRRGAYNREGDD